jgi:hypothetical protein
LNLSALSSDLNVKKWIVTDYSPWTLSIQSSRLLVAAYEHSSVYLYSCDGELLRKIELPSYMLVRRAVETSRGTVIACYRNRRIGDVGPEKRPGLCEVSSEGEVLCEFKGHDTYAFEEPRYLTIDSKQHILVCDRDKREIVHLDRELMLKQILLTKQDLRGQPYRLYYNDERRLLYICSYDSPRADVYRL